MFYNVKFHISVVRHYVQVLDYKVKYFAIQGFRDVRLWLDSPVLACDASQTLVLEAVEKRVEFLKDTLFLDSRRYVLNIDFGTQIRRGLNCVSLLRVPNDFVDFQFVIPG